MKKTSLLMMLDIGVMIILCGCDVGGPAKTGFLSDYSMLEPVSSTSMRYLPAGNKLRNYQKFIIDPVAIHFHTGAQAIEARSKGNLTSQDLSDMKNYMHDAMVKAISDKYTIAYRPGPGVARVRVALTDLKESNPVLNTVPASKMTGVGLGAVSLEAEIIDSQTNEQIAALVESQVGNRLSFEGMTQWGDAKAIMDRWAKRFRQRLDEAHGN